MPAEGGPAVAVSDLRYAVGGREVLSGVDLEVGRGISVAVVGPSGSGKTTLLTCIAGLTRPQAGSIRVTDVDVTRLKARELAAYRLGHIGFVYQFGELLPELTPVENVALPAQLLGQRTAAAQEAAMKLLVELGVGGVVDTPTSDLSGGERQRVAVARALVTSPAVVLADEPTGSLDEASVDAVADLLFSLPSRQGCALVVVTHNQRVAARADQGFELTAGRLVRLT